MCHISGILFYLTVIGAVSNAAWTPGERGGLGPMWAWSGPPLDTPPWSGPPPIPPPWSGTPPSSVFRKPIDTMVDLTNDLGVAILQDYSHIRSNFAFSPYGLASVLVVLYEGSAGESARQIHMAGNFPWDRDITRIGFRDIHRHLRSYFSHEGYLSGITMNKSKSTLKPDYKRVLRFYGYDVDVEPPRPTTPAATTRRPLVEVPVITSQQSKSPTKRPALKQPITPSSAIEGKETLDEATQQMLIMNLNNANTGLKAPTRPSSTTPGYTTTKPLTSRPTDTPQTVMLKVDLPSSTTTKIQAEPSTPTPKTPDQSTTDENIKVASKPVEQKTTERERTSTLKTTTNREKTASTSEATEMTPSEGFKSPTLSVSSEFTASGTTTTESPVVTEVRPGISEAEDMENMTGDSEKLSVRDNGMLVPHAHLAPLLSSTSAATDQAEDLENVPTTEAVTEEAALRSREGDSILDEVTTITSASSNDATDATDATSTAQILSEIAETTEKESTTQLQDITKISEELISGDENDETSQQGTTATPPTTTDFEESGTEKMQTNEDRFSPKEETSTKKTENKMADEKNLTRRSSPWNIRTLDEYMLGSDFSKKSQSPPDREITISHPEDLNPRTLDELLLLKDKENADDGDFLPKTLEEFLLRKNSRLTNDERDIVKRSPEWTVRTLDEYFLGDDFARKGLTPPLRDFPVSQSQSLLPRTLDELLLLKTKESDKPQNIPKQMIKSQNAGGIERLKSESPKTPVKTKTSDTPWNAQTLDEYFMSDDYVRKSLSPPLRGLTLAQPEILLPRTIDEHFLMKNNKEDSTPQNNDEYLPQTLQEYLPPTLEEYLPQTLEEYLLQRKHSADTVMDDLPETESNGAEYLPKTLEEYLLLRKARMEAAEAPIQYKTQLAFRRFATRRKARTISDMLHLSTVPDLSLQLQNGMFDSHVSRREELYRPLPRQSFLMNSAAETPVPVMTYTNVFPFAYIPRLHSNALEFPLDDERYKLLIILPVERRGLRQLTSDLSEVTLRGVLEALRPARVKATVPTFMVEGFVILTPALQRLGIWNVFDPRRANLSSMSTDPELYVRNVEQSVTVVIRNYVEILDIQTRTMAARTVEHEFIATHPFLYFILDTETNVALMAGQMLDPLNSRVY